MRGMSPIIGSGRGIPLRLDPFRICCGFRKNGGGRTGGDRRSHYSVSRMLKSVVAAGRRQGKNHNVEYN